MSNCRKELEARQEIPASPKRIGQDGRVYDTDKLRTNKKKPTTKTTTSETKTHKTVVETPTEADVVEEHEEPKRAYVLEGEN